MIFMSEEEYIDFKKEFEEFKKELENSKPVFDDENIEFDDLGNLIGENALYDLNDAEINRNNSLNDNLNSMESFPNIRLETDDMMMNIIIKKDYSDIKDFDERKKEFIKDLKDFIDEFESTDESDKLMKFYDE